MTHIAAISTVGKTRSPNKVPARVKQVSHNLYGHVVGDRAKPESRVSPKKGKQRNIVML